MAKDYNLYTIWMAYKEVFCIATPGTSSDSVSCHSENKAQFLLYLLH